MGGHHVDGPLAHAHVELVMGDGLGPGGQGVGGLATVEEDQVQIGAIAQFDPPQLAIADDQEAGAAALLGNRRGDLPGVPGVSSLPGCLPAPHGRAMALRQVAVGQGDHPVQAGLGDIREVVADHHQGDDAGEVGGGHP